MKVKKRLLSFFLALTVCCSPALTAFASGAEGENTDASKNPVVQAQIDDDNVVVEKDDRPYLALGADLTDQQRETVFELMGINSADLANYDVVYITNEMEHKYLDAYLPSSTIGTEALSSVLIMKGSKGSGIRISTKNISYCTVSMYKNALATAGIEDAEIIVAGPFPITGTAALIGVMNAYAEMTGEEIKEENLDTAMNELVVTGELVDSIDTDEGQAEKLISYLKKEVIQNELKSEESIREVIERGCQEYRITLTPKQTEEMENMLLKISNLDLNWDQLADQASDLYEQMGDLSEDGVVSKIKSFFQNVIEFFRNLFS